MTERPLPDIRIPMDRTSILWLFGFALMLGLLTYGFDLFNVILAIDQETAGFRLGRSYAWLAQGKWATYLLNTFVLRNPIMPVVPMSIAIFGLAASYTLSSITWRWPIGWAHYLAAPFAVSFPVLVHLFVFLNLSHAIGVGLLLASIAIYVTATERRGALALAILPMTFAIGCYQPLILFPLVSGLTYTAIRLPDDGMRPSLQRLGRFGLLLAASAASYYAIWRLWLWAAGLVPGYTDAYFHLHELGATPGPILAASARYAWSILSGSADLYQEKRNVFSVTMLLAACLVLADGWRKRRNTWQFFFLMALIVALMLAPLLVVMCSLGSAPYRTLLGVPVAFAALIFMAGLAERPRLARSALALLCALCLLGFVNGSNRLLYLHSLVVQADRDLANRIMDRIYALGVSGRDGPIPAEFVGAHAMPESPNFPRVQTSTLGASFFEWDGGNPGRIMSFMASLGYELTRISPRQRAVLRARIDAMPSWPDAGSVQLLDGIVVVKFSDYTPGQHRILPLPN